MFKSLFTNASHFSIEKLTVNNVGGKQVNIRNDVAGSLGFSGNEVMERPICSVSLLATIVGSIRSPSLEFSRELVLSILKTVARVPVNKDMLLELAERTIQAIVTIDDALHTGDLCLQERHVKALTQFLKEVEKCAEEDGYQGWISRIVFPRRVAYRIRTLEKDLDEILAMFNIVNLLSLQKFLASQSVPTRTVAYEEIGSVQEIRRGSGFTVNSTQLDGRFVILKVYDHDPQAKKRLESTLKFSRLFLNENILRALAVSSPSSGVLFIVFDGSCKASTECKIASALTDSLSRSVRLGLIIVSGLSAGLDHLFVNKIPPSYLEEEKLEIYITNDDILQIGFDVGTDIGLAEDSASNENLEDKYLRMLDNLCRKTFEQASCSLYEDRNIDENDRPESFSDIPEDSVPSGSTLGSNNSPGSQPGPTEEPSTSVKPRRELIWRVPPERLATVSSIAQHYRVYIERAQLRNVKYLPFRQLRAHTGVWHRCLGYKKEEITLTASVEENAVISHATPSRREICSVCGEIVNDNDEFNCICGLGDNGVSANIRCSRCHTWSHSDCANWQGEHTAFVCHLCRPPVPSTLDSSPTPPPSPPPLPLLEGSSSASTPDDSLTSGPAVPSTLDSSPAPPSPPPLPPLEGSSSSAFAPDDSLTSGPAVPSTLDSSPAPPPSPPLPLPEGSSSSASAPYDSLTSGPVVPSTHDSSPTPPSSPLPPPEGSSSSDSAPDDSLTSSPAVPSMLDSSPTPPSPPLPSPEGSSSSASAPGDFHTSGPAPGQQERSEPTYSLKVTQVKSGSSGDGLYRQRLDSWAQSNGVTPVYNERASGPANVPVWICYLRINNTEYGRGQGRKRAEARENAARQACGVVGC
ncbi:hypothetical protein VKT23_016276 [Stygiomarasmius scandens]|uniref:DRBM domain-containing protein n=1 Tax=Marasmiellus scandens TaxID=2682957 RepID=A0ABR1IXM9_9AGAR